MVRAGNEPALDPLPRPAQQALTRGPLLVFRLVRRHHRDRGRKQSPDHQQQIAERGQNQRTQEAPPRGPVRIGEQIGQGLADYVLLPDHGQIVDERQQEPGQQQRSEEQPDGTPLSGGLASIGLSPQAPHSHEHAHQREHGEQMTGEPSSVVCCATGQAQCEDRSKHAEPKGNQCHPPFQ